MQLRRALPVRFRHLLSTLAHRARPPPPQPTLNPAPRHRRGAGRASGRIETRQRLSLPAVSFCLSDLIPLEIAAVRPDCESGLGQCPLLPRSSRMIFRAVWRDQCRPLQNRRQLQFVDAPDELDVIFNGRQQGDETAGRRRHGRYRSSISILLVAHRTTIRVSESVGGGAPRPNSALRFHGA